MKNRAKLAYDEIHTDVTHAIRVRDVICAEHKAQNDRVHTAVLFRLPNVDFFNKLDHKSIINYCCEVRLTDWLLSFRLVRQMKLIKLATLISSCPADEAVCNRTRCSREIAARSQTCKGKRPRKNS